MNEGNEQAETWPDYRSFQAKTREKVVPILRLRAHARAVREHANIVPNA